MVGNSRTTSGALPPLDPFLAEGRARAQRGENALADAGPATL
jgi:hypothetical protein